MAVPKLKPDLDVLRGALPAGLAGRVQSARQLLQPAERREREPPLPSGWPELDRLLAGGLERGVLTELVGGPSSGRFSVVLRLLAKATALGETAALVDLGGHLEPEAVRRCGGDPERLLWVLPPDVRRAQDAAERLLACGIHLVVLDLGSPPVPGGRGKEGAWVRLARAARDRRAVFLLASPYRASGTAAGVVLDARKERARWLGSPDSSAISGSSGSFGPGRLLAGLDVRLSVEKSRLRAPSGRPRSERLSLQVDQ